MCSFLFCFFMAQEQLVGCRKKQRYLSSALKAPEETALEDYLSLLHLRRDEAGSCLVAAVCQALDHHHPLLASSPSCSATWTM
jgi:hypothetical protein